MPEENLRDIVNGSLLKNYVGQKVSITGLVKTVSSSGLSFEITSSDSIPVKVTMKKPNENLLEGYVEVHGVYNGNAILCEELVVFDNDESEEFDVNGHNTAVMLFNSLTNVWKYD